MTTLVTGPPAVRTAKRNAVCGSRACLALIYAGSAIVKIPGGAWRHADCSKPGRRAKADRDAERAEAARRRRWR